MRTPPRVTVPRRYNAAYDFVEKNVVQGREETALNKAGQYCLDNLINRLYSP